MTRGAWPPRLLSLPVIGLLATGFVASRLIDTLPDLLRFALVLLLVTYLTGECVRRFLGRPLEARIAGRLSAAFFLGLSLHAVVAALCTILSLSFTGYVIVLQILWFVLFGTSLVFRRETETETRSGSRIIVLIAMGAALVASVTPNAPSDDGYAQLAFVRSTMTSDEISPPGVLAPARSDEGLAWEVGGASQRGRGLYHAVLAAVATTADVAPPVVWRWMAIVLAFFAVLVFWLLTEVLLPASGLYRAGAVLLFLIFQAGLGAGFPLPIGHAPLSSLLVTWLLFVLVVEKGSGRMFGAVALLLIGGAVMFPLVLVHWGLVLVSLLIAPRLFGLTRRAILAVVILSAACMVVAAMRSATFASDRDVDVIYGALLYVAKIGGALFIDHPSAVAERYGILFVASMVLVPGLLLVHRHRRFARINFALAAPAVIVVLSPWITPAVYRAGLPPASVGWLSIPGMTMTALVFGSLVGWGRNRRLLHKLLAIVLLAIWAQVFLADLRGWRRDVTRARAGRPAEAVEERWRGLIDFVGAAVPPGSTILSDAKTSEVLGANCDVNVVIVPGQSISPVANPRARLRDVGNALSIYTTQIEAEAVMRRYGVDYVVLNGAVADAYDWQNGGWHAGAMEVLRRKFGASSGACELVYDKNDALVYRVTLGDSPIEYGWFPEMVHGRRPAVITPCAPAAEDDGPRITGVAVTPAEVLAGERVKLFIRYRRDTDRHPIEPLALTIRLEHAEYFSSRGAYPGDRLVRIVDEKRGGAVRQDIFHRPFAGLYTAEMWPIGRDIYEILEIQISRELREGTYDVMFSMGHGQKEGDATLLDFLYNDDSFAGAACTDIDVRHFLTR